MADTDGIIQWISLKLNRGAIKIAEEEAKDAGRKVANATVAAMANGDAASQAVAKYVEQMQRAFDQRLGKIQDKLINGLSSEKVAQTAADKLAKSFNEKLAMGIDKLTGGKLNQDKLDKLIGSVKFGPVDITKGIAGGGMFGDQDFAKLENTARRWFWKIRDDWSQVWRIPAATDITRGLDRDLRKQATKGGKLDPNMYRDLVNEAKAAQQIASSTLTPLGKLYRQLGVDVSNLHPLLTQQPSLWGRISTALGPVGRALGLTMSAYRAFRFAVQSVKEFAEQDQQLYRLSNSLADYGTRLAAVEPAVKAMFDANLKLGYTYTQSAEIFGTLIQLTGDYKESLRAVPTVLDVMAARTDMTMSMAAKSVARAIVGSNESLQRQGIYLKENVNVIDQLNARFGGEALAKANSYAGTLQQIAAVWHQIKVAIGEALVAGGGGHAAGDIFIAMLQSILKWIKENQYAIGVFGTAISGAFMAAGVVINGFLTGIRLAVAVVGTLWAAIRTGPAIAKVAMGNIATVMLEGFKKVTDFMDKWLHTDFGEGFKKAVNDMKKWTQEGRVELANKRAENTDALFSILGLNDDTNIGPLAPEQPLGRGHKVQAREHQQITKNITNLRKMGLVNDAEDSAKAVEELNKQLADMKEHVENTKDDFKEQVLWAGHVREIEQALALIEKKRSDEAAKRKAESLLNQQIEINGALLLGQRDSERAGALKNLNRIEQDLNEKLRQGNLTKQDALVIEKHLEQIADFRARRLEQVNKTEDDQIKRLSKMVELNVDRQSALETLHKLELQYTAELEEARKRGDVVAAERAATRLADIERAEHIQVDLINERIARLKEETQVAETRKRSTQELFNIERQLERKLTDPKTLERDKDELRRIIQDIKSFLGTPVDVQKLRQNVNALTELTKHARTSQQALQDLETMLSTLRSIEGQGNLTDNEVAQVKALIERIQKTLREHPLSAEPFLKDLKETMIVELPDVMESVATTMADRFTLATTYMLRDIRNVKHALDSMWKGLAASLADELKKMAQLRAKENLAEALSHTARGIGDLFVNPAAAAGEFRAAAAFGAAAAAWTALAGVAGSVGISANAAYSNATDFANNRGSSPADGNAGGGPDIYIQIDGVDPKNAAHQRLIGDTMRFYRARYGNNIYINGERAA